ncbi:MAG: DUF1269 domain-containing protein [Chroococcidiopsidaceae cyanobacterium CP_BM_RX_35]|nr:DUF1269 domain-containing protein [Chroococcidiopsidaceae cyanobacterium CP_BM_RX_35]
MVGFKDEFKADEVLLDLSKLQREHLIDLEDAAVVIRNQKGKVRIKQTQDLVTSGALSGGLWGLLLGFIFFSPFLGWAVGAAAGALSGGLTDIGIDDDFIREIGNTIEQGTSAIFILVRQATPDKVLAEISQFGGKVIRSSLSSSDEAKLQEALTKGQAT